MLESQHTLVQLWEIRPVVGTVSARLQRVLPTTGADGVAIAECEMQQDAAESDLGTTPEKSTSKLPRMNGFPGTIPRSASSGSIG
jgi:hypothetical protein